MYVESDNMAVELSCSSLSSRRTFFLFIFVVGMDVHYCLLKPLKVDRGMSMCVFLNFATAKEIYICN